MSNTEPARAQRTPRAPNSRRWSDDDVQSLRRLAWSMTAAQVALVLGRTILAVRTKAAHERIRLRGDSD